MADSAITNIAMTLNAGVVATATAAVADTADLAEVFDFTPKKGSKYLIVINNISAANGTVSVSIAAGVQFGANAALTATIAQGVSKAFQVDTAKYVDASGIINVTVTPASGKKLKTDHTLTVQGIQLA